MKELLPCVDALPGTAGNIPHRPKGIFHMIKNNYERLSPGKGT
jgi:hypothetical protein